MVGHLVHSGLDPHHPATLSTRLIDEMLRKGIGYDGVVITDGMDMAAVAEQFPLDQRIELALNAGVDLLLFDNNLVFDIDRPQQVVDTIVAGVEAGRITERCLADHAMRVTRLRDAVATSPPTRPV